MPSRPGSAERPLRVAIVGAGPSGFYTAAALLAEAGFEVSIDILDRLPAPHGLVRYGVAPDHPKIKAVSRVFDKLATDPRLRFLGNVEYGRDLGHADLERHYDQVVYAVGGQSDRHLGIPGENLQGSYSSTEFVAWYSSHPDFIALDPVLDGVAAAVVGIGNVAIDVARILARSPDDLTTTDIADYALDALSGSRIRDVHILARRGPVQAKCSPAELKEMGDLDGVDLVVDPAELELDPASAAELAGDRQAQKNLELLRAFAERGTTGAPRRIHLRFLASPVEILAHAANNDGGRVGALRVERNRLEGAVGGYLKAAGTGDIKTLPVDMVVRAVGYRSLPLPDLPFDDRRAIIPNQRGRILDPASGRPRTGEYVVGWVKRGPTGLIGSNKPDGVETAAAMVEDLPTIEPAADELATPEAVDRLLEGRGVRVLGFADWRRLDRLETERGEAQGRPRVKFATVEEMLAALDATAESR